MTAAKKKSIIIIALFIIMAIVMTYPLIFKMHSHIAGFSSTDEPYGVLWDMWWYKYAHQNGLNYYKCDFIAYPFGIDISKLIGGSFFWDGIKHYLTIVTGEIAAYNIIILSSFLLSAIFMYYLTLYTTNSLLPSLFSAIIFAFSPYHFARSWQHLALSQIQWMPFYLLVLFKLKDKPDLRNTILLAIAFFLVASFNFYYAYFMLVATAIFLLYDILARRHFKNTLMFARRILLAYAIVLLLISPAIYQVFKSRNEFINAPYGHNLAVRPFQDLLWQSARPLSYILPSPEHPILGGITQNFIGTGIYGQSLTEHALYLGWTAMILAYIAFRRWRRACKLSAMSYELSAKRDNFYIGYFLFLAIGAWLFSQPAWWKLGTLKIYMPSFFMYKILPMFRAYCRFGIVLMLAVAVLAGFGLKSILSRRKESASQIIVAVIFCGLIIFEFWNYPPFKVIDLSKVPQVYYWLKNKPKDTIIAEYPIDIDTANEKRKFYQSIHEKKTIDSTFPGSYANRVSRVIVNLSQVQAPSYLSWMGVRYVLVHKADYLSTELVEKIEELARIKLNPGLKFIQSFDDIDVYEVKAEKKDPQAEIENEIPK